jgi:hypothetical protein
MNDIADVGKTNPIKPNPPTRYAIRNTRYEIQTQSNPICKILSSPNPGLAAEGIFPIITARKPSGEGEQEKKAKAVA